MSKILWLTVDRSKRVAPHIFKSLQNEVSKIYDVDFIVKKLDKITGFYCKDVFLEGRKEEPTLDPQEVNKYDLVFSDAFFAYIYEDWKKITVPKAGLIEDLHGDVNKKYIQHLHHETDIDFFCAFYKNAFLDRYSYIAKSKPLVWIPHSIDPNLFMDYNLNKKYDYLSIGVTQKSIYPVRAKCLQLFKNETGFKRFPRPKERTFNKRFPTKKQYAQILNSSKMVFSDLSIFNYPVMKTFEIPACYSVLASTWNKDMEELGFVSDENFLKLNLFLDIKEKAEDLLKDKDKYNHILNNGYNLVHSQHTSDIRAFQLINYFKEIGVLT